MKKFICAILLACMLLCCPAMATGRVIQQAPVEEKPYYIDCFDLAGMNKAEVQAYLEENDRQLTGVTLDYTSFPNADGEFEEILRGFYGDGGGFGVYGMSVNLDFNGELSEEMLADGWIITSRQFEGGYWYNRLECPGAEEGHTLYTMYIQTDGDKIMYMEFKIVDIKAFLAAKAAEAVE